jgi:hypothetical protein
VAGIAGLLARAHEEMSIVHNTVKRIAAVVLTFATIGAAGGVGLAGSANAATLPGASLKTDFVTQNADFNQPTMKAPEAAGAMEVTEAAEAPELGMAPAAPLTSIPTSVASSGKTDSPSQGSTDAPGEVSADAPAQISMFTSA